MGTEFVTSEPWTGAEQRVYPRYELSCPVRLDLYITGGDSPRRVLQTNGKTINVSRGGMLAGIERAIPVDSCCLVHFLHTDELYVRPKHQWGTTIRVGAVGEGCQLAIKFDEPLEFLTASSGTES